MTMGYHARRFDRAAATYGGLSGPQDRMAGRLATLAPAEAPGRGEGPAVLEMGCGTGHLTRLLRERFPGAALLVTDAAPRMLAEAQAAGGEAEYALFDAEGGEPPAEVRARGPFALAASSALVQWFPDLEGHFRLVASLLRPGGTYLVSGFGEDHFPELNAILRREPFGYRHFPGHGHESAKAAASAAGLEIVRWEEESLETRHASPREFLQAIRGLGAARRPEAGKPLTRAKLAYLEETYRQSAPAPGGGVLATWRPWYARLRRL